MLVLEQMSTHPVVLRLYELLRHGPYKGTLGRLHENICNGLGYKKKEFIGQTASVFSNKLKRLSRFKLDPAKDWITPSDPSKYAVKAQKYVQEYRQYVKDAIRIAMNPPSSTAQTARRTYLHAEENRSKTAPIILQTRKRKTATPIRRR